MQAGVLPNPIKTIKHLWRIGRNKASIYAALALARKNIPGFDDYGGALQEQVATMYVRINEAQANFTLDRIKDVSGLHAWWLPVVERA
jgi:hypothetical protein